MSTETSPASEWAEEVMCSECGCLEADPDPYFEGMCEGCYRAERMCAECGGVGYTLDHSECLGWVAACEKIDCETCHGVPHPDAPGRFTIWESGDSPHAAPAGLLRPEAHR